MAERRMFDGQRRTEILVDDILLEGGRAYALCGPSGIGKTTALEMLSLARKPDTLKAMSLEVGGRTLDLSAQEDDDRMAGLRGTYFGYVVQTAHLFPFITARQNIELSQTIARRADPVIVDELMDELQLASLGKSMPAHLSGGQRQRVCVARALAHSPAVVLADEPTSAVDHEMGDRIMQTLCSYAMRTNAIVLVITHNVPMVKRFGLLMLAVDSSVTDGTLRTRISGPPAVSEDATARPDHTEFSMPARC